MKNLFTALKNLIVSSFIFTSKVNTELQNTTFCPECGALLFTNEDLEAYANVGICEACFIRISDESLLMCENWYYNEEEIESIDDDTSDIEYHQHSSDYCEADNLVSCPTCGRPMSSTSLQYQNVGECEQCYFGF